MAEAHKRLLPSTAHLFESHKSTQILQIQPFYPFIRVIEVNFTNSRAIGLYGRTTAQGKHRGQGRRHQ